MKLYNDLTRKKEEFVPIKQGEVTIYNCGPTVYNYFHIGNARCFVVFEALRRYFKHLGYKVTYVQNFTDIDDKLIKRAAEEDTTVKAVAEKYIEEYFKDAQGLGIEKADIHPKATECADDIIEFVQRLIDGGYAYPASNGDVYFSTKSFKGYGKLSHQPIDELESGARIDINELKRDPLDFALWKAAKEGEPYWESPWGHGRPGWHIECSAMACKYLGKTIDIHGGGQDLVFPHHENEIAQSEAANGAPFANYWLHNAYININGQKMSKSKNNFFLVRDIAKDFDYPVMRFFLLSAHYRTPINFSYEIMEQSKAGLARLTTCRDNVRFLKESAGGTLTESEKASLAKIDGHRSAFYAALDDDFNTADAVSILFEIAREINSASNGASLEYLQAAGDIFEALADVLGLFAEKNDSLDGEITALVEERTKARAERNWARADEIRDKLKELGIVLEDTPQGVKWHRI